MLSESDKLGLLKAALADAARVAAECDAIFEEQANRRLDGRRADWAQAVGRMADQVAGKAGYWSALLALYDQDPRPREQPQTPREDRNSSRT